MKICFLSLNSYPILAEEDLGYSGGAEVEQVILGKELLSKGYNICFVTYDCGIDQKNMIGGIEVIKTYDRIKSSQMNNMLKFKLIWSSLAKANADIYFHESGSTGILPQFCFLNRKKFVYRIPSDAVVLGKPLSDEDSGLQMKIAHILEVKGADAVIVQSNFQKEILVERFGVDSVVIKNGLTLRNSFDKKLDPPIILWVGSISTLRILDYS